MDTTYKCALYYLIKMNKLLLKNQMSLYDQILLKQVPKTLCREFRL